MVDNIEAQKRRAARLRQKIGQIGQSQPNIPLTPRDAIEKRMRELDKSVKQPTIIIQQVEVTEVTLTVHLNDQRTVTVPLTWFPWLLNTSTEKRNNWCFSVDKTSIQWTDLHEEIKISDLLQF